MENDASFPADRRIGESLSQVWERQFDFNVNELKRRVHREWQPLKRLKGIKAINKTGRRRTRG
jgi:hypothetical protein